MLDIYGGLKILDETISLKNLIEPIKNNKGCINYYPERSGADNLAETVGKRLG